MRKILAISMLGAFIGSAAMAHDHHCPKLPDLGVKLPDVKLPDMPKLPDLGVKLPDLPKLPDMPKIPCTL